MRRKKLSIIITSIILFILISCVGMWLLGASPKTSNDKSITREESVDDAMEEEHLDKESVNNETLTSEVESKNTSDQTSNERTSTAGKDKTEEKTTAHVHKWVAKQSVVTHPEKGHYEKECVKEAWVEDVPKYEEIAVEVCGNCGAEFTTDPSEHIKEHMLSGTGTKGCRTEYRQVQVGVEQVKHEAEYTEKWVVDEKAKEETVTTYSCACGATK